MTRDDNASGQLHLGFDPPQASRRIWPVGELVEQVRKGLEQEYGDIWVEGEISNLRHAPSGHIYCTLKDEAAQLPVVLFRRQAVLLRFRPEDGLHVLARGRASVYNQRGQLQLVAETMEPVGAGSLQLAFEQLKERLKSEGLFDRERKRALPAFPRTVGIVTSPSGAVIRDFLNIAGRRHTGLNILLFPAPVQGEQAPAEIESGLAALNASGVVDVIVIARGGGSLEDLAAFNSERVARAIAASRVPVVSAVGHETDFTIADFVADLRAPTPSAAAELITEAHYGIAEHLDNLLSRLERAVRFRLLQARQTLDALPAGRMEWCVSTHLRRLDQNLDDVTYRMDVALGDTLHKLRHRSEVLAFAMSGSDPRRAIGLVRERLFAGRTALNWANERGLREREGRLVALRARLHALSPLAVLDRGYALVMNAEGAVIRSTAQVARDDRMITRVGDGTFTSRVETISPAKHKKKTKR